MTGASPRDLVCRLHRRLEEVRGELRCLSMQEVEAYLQLSRRPVAAVNETVPAAVPDESLPEGEPVVAGDASWTHERQYLDHSIDELQAVVELNLFEDEVLLLVLEELRHRRSSKAQSLLESVEEQLRGLEPIVEMSTGRIGLPSEQSVLDQGAEATGDSSTVESPCPICGEHPADTAFRGKPACTSCKNELSDTW